ncbi:hypothetical protein [Streptomyces sp. NPDC007206]|uniref:hypothetical protein n=1 Tax=Streptomyces sp. NPDC007206 TaxID=3154317 RepID=UPI0033C4C3BA
MGLALVSSGGGVYALADGAAPASPAPSASAEPDLVPAQAAARRTGSRVEITGEETATSKSWANPDDTLTTQVFDAPVRIRQHGIWTPINTTLSDTGDSVTPRVTPSTSGSAAFLAAPVDKGGDASADDAGADASSLTATNPDANDSSDTDPVAVDLVLDTGSTVTPYATSIE